MRHEANYRAVLQSAVAKVDGGADAVEVVPVHQSRGDETVIKVPPAHLYQSHAVRHVKALVRQGDHNKAQER